MFSQLIGVVWSCSPGPGLSRARRGPGVPSERVRSSRSVCRAPRLSFPLAPWGGWGRQGLGAASGPDLRSPVPRLGVSSGVIGIGHSRCSCFASLACAPRAALPRWGGLCRCQAARPHGCLAGPSVVLLERSRSSLRCPKPSGGVVFPLKRKGKKKRKERK